MKHGRMISAAMAAAMAVVLGGCAAPTTGVNVMGPAPGFAATGSTYTLVRTAASRDRSERARVEAAVREALARDGWREVGVTGGASAASDDASVADGVAASAASRTDARYRLSIAYATQPAAVALDTQDCGGGGGGSGGSASAPYLGVDGSAPPAWPFARPRYRHLLTLRFVDAGTGARAYQVTAAVRDRDPAPLAAVPVLVRAALAKLPFEGASGWIVRTKKDDALAVPGVVSVVPASAGAR
ncbi:MAG: hypothetical protein GAK40_00788 [Burkholderia plantarii]|nr:MAG: hypothetical protein GAK40_00788 [Burkholderia plantarii]